MRVPFIEFIPTRACKLVIKDSTLTITYGTITKSILLAGRAGDFARHLQDLTQWEVRLLVPKTLPLEGLPVNLTANCAKSARFTLYGEKPEPKVPTFIQVIDPEDLPDMMAISSE